MNSDDDFDTSGWTGNGTIDNPYLLANKTIEGECCIRIADTRCHFRVENCTLNAEYYGIILSNVTNAVLVDCIVNSEQLCIYLLWVTNVNVSRNSIHSGERGIEVEQSSQCGIANNSIEAYTTGLRLDFLNQCYIEDNSISCRIEKALALSHSTNVAIIDNTFLGGDHGLSSWESHDCDVFNNTIASNEYAILVRESSNNSIIGNRLGSVEGDIAIDDGTDNLWDDNTSLGNAWLDYQGSGEYQIPGSANSIDHFPTKFDPSFPMDFGGPTIGVSLGFLCFDFIDEMPSSWRFMASVRDPSGVDTVIITVNGESHVMSHQPTTEDPDHYIYDYPNPTFMTHSYWANDSLGHSSSTGEGFISVGVIQGRRPDMGMLYVTIGGLLALMVVVIAILRRQSQSS